MKLILSAHFLSSHWLTFMLQEVMSGVLDPRLAVAKFEHIARKQAAKLRESASVNFHRCELAPASARQLASPRAASAPREP